MFNLKKTGKSKPGPEAQRQQLVEEFIDLDREVETYKPRIQRYERLRLLILDWHRNLSPDAEALVNGQTADVLISARDQVRKVTPAGKKLLWKLWGKLGFIAKAHIELKMLPDPKDPASLYTEKASTGPRHLHVVAKAAAAIPAA